MTQGLADLKLELRGMAKKSITKYVTLLGKRYAFKRVPYLGDAYGTCDPTDKKNKTIRVLSNLRGEKELSIIIHEALHALDWSKDEEWIVAAANDLAKMLYKLEYRKQEKAKKK